jgi:hypothetical protein
VIDQLLHTPHAVPDVENYIAANNSTAASTAVKQQPSPPHTATTSTAAANAAETGTAGTTAPVDHVKTGSFSKQQQAVAAPSTFIESVLSEMKHAWSYSSLSSSGAPGKRSFCDVAGLSAAVWSVTLVRSSLCNLRTVHCRVHVNHKNCLDRVCVELVL